MVLVETAVVLGAVGLAFYVLVRVLTGATRPAASAGPGQWRTHHYDAKGSTRVVVQKVSAGGTNILDEHVVDTIRLDDPDYDASFMAAMARARERRALFEAEQDS